LPATSRDSSSRRERRLGRARVRSPPNLPDARRPRRRRGEHRDVDAIPPAAAIGASIRESDHVRRGRLLPDAVLERVHRRKVDRHAERTVARLMKELRDLE
jgi:hypothetical protein